MSGTLNGTIQSHNERPAAVWSSGGKDYDAISQGLGNNVSWRKPSMLTWREL